MKISKLLTVSAGLVLAMLALSAWAYQRLGEAPVAVHWGLNGMANGYASKASALLILPALAAAISALLGTLPQVIPSRDRLERSRKAYGVRWMGTLLVLLVVHAVIIAKASGASFDIVRPITLVVAAFMLLLGNYMGKIRYNYVFGFRTPWTLSDERVWDKTHRVLGRCTVVAALVLLGLAWLAPSGLTGNRLLASAMAVCAIAPALAALVFSIQASQRTVPKAHHS